MTEPIDPQARALIESFEGYHDALPDGRCKPYRCPAKIPTLGFGATYYESGRKVQMSDPPITRARASELLSNQLVIYAAAVDKSVKTPIHPLMRGACISLAFNIGTSAFGKSTALRLINQRRWSEVPAAFARYRIGGGRVLAGLERRRKAEGALFMAGVRLLQAGGGTVTPLVAESPAPPAPAKSSIFGRFLSLFQRAA
jgi:lysozyme